MHNAQLKSSVRTAIEISIYLLLIFALVFWCLQIIMPFVSFLLWGTIIAVATHRPFLKLLAAVGERKKLADGQAKIASLRDEIKRLKG